MRRAHAARTSAAVLAAGGLSLLVAACGGSHGPQAAAGQTGAVAFSSCMRAHGVPTYPDPGGSGLLPKRTPQQLGVSSSTFEAAQSACIHLVPNGGRPTPAQVQHYRIVMLVYARCMRAHGVSNMPDPDARGHLDIGPGTDVDVDSPSFQGAFQVCKAKLTP